MPRATLARRTSSTSTARRGRETTILRASNAEANDEFGRSVSLSGDRALVGAFGEAGPTNATSNSGAAYVFELSTAARGRRRPSSARATPRNSTSSGSPCRSRATARSSGRREDGRERRGSSGAAYVFELSRRGVDGDSRPPREQCRPERPLRRTPCRSRATARSSGRSARPGQPMARAPLARRTCSNFVGAAWTETTILRASNADADDHFGVLRVALGRPRVRRGAQRGRADECHEQLWRGVHVTPSRPTRRPPRTTAQYVYWANSRLQLHRPFQHRWLRRQSDFYCWRHLPTRHHAG